MSPAGEDRPDTQELDFAAYLEACNRRDWQTVRTFFADEVVVNGERTTGARFVAKLAAIEAQHPDRRWRVMSLTRSDDTLVASLLCEDPEQYGTQLVTYTTVGSTITQISFV